MVKWRKDPKVNWSKRDMKSSSFKSRPSIFSDEDDNAPSPRTSGAGARLTGLSSSSTSTQPCAISSFCPFPWFSRFLAGNARGCNTTESKKMKCLHTSVFLCSQRLDTEFFYCYCTYHISRGGNWMKPAAHSETCGQETKCPTTNVWSGKEPHRTSAPTFMKMIRPWINCWRRKGEVQYQMPEPCPDAGMERS